MLVRGFVLVIKVCVVLFWLKCFVVLVVVLGVVLLGLIGGWLFLIEVKVIFVLVLIKV